jgi:signal transduction histidine kinase
MAQPEDPSIDAAWPLESPLREAFSDLPYVLVVTRGLDHRIEFCNPATFNIFQVGPDIIGRPLADVYPRFAEEGHLRTFTHVYNTGEVVYRREVPLTSPQWPNAIKYFDIGVRPLRNHSGEIAGVIGHAVEVTSQVLARQRLEQAVRARDDFASAVSHELRNPLNTLAIHIATMKLKLSDNSRPEPLTTTRERVEKMDETMGILSNVVDRLLDVSRMVQGRLQLHRVDFDLGRESDRAVGKGRILAHEVVDRMADDAHGCQTRIDHLGNLLVNWDQQRIDQVISNLLANAYTYGGGKPVHLMLDASLDGVVRLQDHGVGISPDNQQRIFERFEYAQPHPRTTFGGFGVGLWICRTIVEAHGGRIWVKSKTEAGSCFTLEIPRRPALAAS